MRKFMVLFFLFVFLLSFGGCGNVEKEEKDPSLTPADTTPSITEPSGDGEPIEGNKEIENIIYHSDRGGDPDALERFYSDDIYSYYFPSIRSSVVIVYYKDGSEQTVKDALAEGKIKISDLDRFSIQYYKETY